MEAYDLDKPLLRFSAGDEKACYSPRTALTGTLVTGSTGSGKTTASGRWIAHKFLLEGWGGLVLTAKPDEVNLWIAYCKETGRSNDLVIIGPETSHRFNFLEYESSTADNERSITANIVDVLKTVIDAGSEKQAVNGEGVFWTNAQTMLMGNVVDLCLLAYGKVSVETMYSIVQSLPRPSAPQKDVKEQQKEQASRTSTFELAFELASKNVNAQVEEWKKNIPAKDKEKINDQASYERAVFGAVPDARLSNLLAEFFYGSFKDLNPRTRAIVEFMFSGFLYNLLREPVYSLFASQASTVVPEDCCSKSKIVLVNLPVKKYHKTGKDCQLLVKYCFQRAWEKRRVDASTKPVFLWIDEGHLFLHEHDQEFQTTARGSRIATVMLSQNLPNFYAALGGERAEYKVKSLLSTLSVKIFHCNGDEQTNTYASDLIGDVDFTDPSMSVSVGSDNVSQTRNMGIKREKFVPPEAFTRLKTGGPMNNFKSEAIIHCQGDPLFEGRNHKRVSFDQKNRIW